MTRVTARVVPPQVGRMPTVRSQKHPAERVLSIALIAWAAKLWWSPCAVSHGGSCSALPIDPFLAAVRNVI